MSDDDYTQLFVFVLYWLRMKLYGFVNFVEQHFVPYEYNGISLIAIEASKCMVIIEGDFIVWWWLISYAMSMLIHTCCCYMFAYRVSMG